MRQAAPSHFACLERAQDVLGLHALREPEGQLSLVIRSAVLGHLRKAYPTYSIHKE